jgi:hypothetical protein
MRYLQTGVTLNNRDKATPGYTLFSPIGQFKTFLIDLEGEVAHEWEFPLPPGNYAYLQPNGNLLRASRTAEGPKGMSAKGGLLQEIDWDGNVVWEHTDHHQHHDFTRLPNGNVIYTAWEPLSPEAVARVGGGLAGTDHGGEIYGDSFREVDADGNIVWEWHVETDMEIEKFPICAICHRNEFAHANTVTYDKDGDIMFSQRHNHLVAVIDKATKKLKWDMCDMKLFGHQHDFQQLENGNYLLYANGDHTDVHGPNTGSAILEIDPATKEVVWEYKGQPRHTFYSPHISGCQRLASGNTFICEGIWGRLFEVTPEGEVVWEFINPHTVPADGPGIEGANQVFRAYRYAADSPEIAGRLG